MEDKKYLEFIGKKIIELRNDKGLKQIDLAIKMDIEDSALRRIERGGTNPTIITLKKVADALGVAVKDLLP